MSHIQVPPELWTKDILQFPTCLSEVYRLHLERLNRFEDACTKPPTGDIGGEDEKATHDHFTWRFAASAARNGYLLLDPRTEFDDISADLLIGLADGRISVLDVPCGAGAGILGLLSTLAELRRLDGIGRLPLDISITAGDFSPSARLLYGEMLRDSQTWLAAQEIKIDVETRAWNASEEPSTASLVDRWFERSQGVEEYIVLISAFSGDGAPNFPTFDRSFQHIASRLHNRPGTVLWVEPNMKKAKKYLASALTAFQNLKRWFGADPLRGTQFNWRHPFVDHVSQGSLLVIRHKRIEVPSDS